MVARTAATRRQTKVTKKRPDKRADTNFNPEETEAALRKKYPDARIVRGSILDSNTTDEFGPKRSVEIKCAECDKPRRVATSDLHQVSHCTTCTNDIRKKRRRDARAKNSKPKIRAAATTKTKARAKRKTAPAHSPVHASAEPALNS